ncbi:MAG: hypothetical protein AAB384_00140 [Patescibacteria group bacterium]
MTKICRPWITLRNGKRLYASQRGKRVFCFFVEDKILDKKEEPVVTATDPAI